MKKFLCAIVLLMVIACPSFAMTDYENKMCHAVIHGATATAVGSATLLSQAPGSDNIPLVLCIGSMTVALAEVFDIPLGQLAVETIGAAVIGGFGTAIAARITSQWTVGWIPILGNAVNAATIAGLVEYIGWSIAEAFDQNGWAIKKVITAVRNGTYVVSGFKLIELILSGEIVQVVEFITADK